MDTRASFRRRMIRLSQAGAILGVCLAIWTVAWARSTNGVITTTREGLVSSGGRLGSGNPVRVATVVGEPGGGILTNWILTVRTGYQVGSQGLPAGTRTITVEGTIDDATASVVVNGVPATIVAGTFRAEGVQLVEGPNTITATATDRANHQTPEVITVWLDTHPPARPTAGDPLRVTTDASYELTGTKTPGTSVWINGVEAVPLGDATTWTATVSLVEGDNVLVIVTKDAAGNTSTSATITIIVDNLPPVISGIAWVDAAGVPLRVDPPTGKPKTNFTPVTLRGLVDDSLTRVEANGIRATRARKSFEAALPLVEGANPVTITATSPNGFVSTATLSVTRGTIPAITMVQPPDGTKLYAGAAATLQATATDRENDPLEYQFLLDGDVLIGWSAESSQAWTPIEVQHGPHTIELQVQDDFGGSASARVAVYVLRKPISPP